jgi:hypothetical protein
MSVMDENPKEFIPHWSLSFGLFYNTVNISNYVVWKGKMIGKELVAKVLSWIGCGLI